MNSVMYVLTLSSYRGKISPQRPPEEPTPLVYSTNTTLVLYTAVSDECQSSHHVQLTSTMCFLCIIVLGVVSVYRLLYCNSY